MKDDGGISRQGKLSWTGVPEAMVLLLLLALKCWQLGGNNGSNWLIRDVMELDSWGFACSGIHGHCEPYTVPTHSTREDLTLLVIMKIRANGLLH